MAAIKLITRTNNLDAFINDPSMHIHLCALRSMVGGASFEEAYSYINTNFRIPESDQRRLGAYEYVARAALFDIYEAIELWREQKAALNKYRPIGYEYQVRESEAIINDLYGQANGHIKMGRIDTIVCRDIMGSATRSARNHYAHIYLLQDALR